MVAPDGREIERFPRAPGSGENGSPVPFDSPSSARFLGTRLIVANQAPWPGTAAHQALLDVEAGEPGLPELIPGRDATAPRLTRVSRCRRGGSPPSGAAASRGAPARAGRPEVRSCG